MSRKLKYPRRSLLLTVLPIVFSVFALAASSAFASGRQVIDGHDPDFHCAGDSTDPSCDFFVHAVPFARGGAPDPTKPVLVIDRNGLELQTALQSVFGSALPMQVVDPESSTFATLPLTTSNYSAIIVASDESCGGCDLNTSSSTPDTNALVARKADIKSFFQAGGGIIALSGGQIEDQPPGRCDTYYSFLPLPAPACAATLNGSDTYTLTANGAALGFKTTDFPFPHNEFVTPASGSALQPIATDVANSVSLFGAGPLATTGGATKVTSSKATLHGQVNPEFSSTTYKFQYGTSKSYGRTAPATAKSVGSDNTEHSVSFRVSGLKPSRTYHYRIVATNVDGTTKGADMTFKTKAAAKLHLSVSPKTATAGKTTCFAFTVTSNGHRTSKATVKLAGHSTRTSSHGTAKLCLSLSKGTHTAHATKSGFTSASARIRVTAASPAFTG